MTLDRRSYFRGSGALSAASLLANQSQAQPDAYRKLYYWNEVAKGGHFATVEQPEIFVAELRKSFTQFR